MATVLTTGDLMTTARHDPRVIAAFVGASFALHAALVLMVPGWLRPAPRIVPLEVTLQKVEPPRPLPMAPREPPRPEKRPRERPPPPQERIVQPQPQPLALPKQASVPEPVFTIPVPEARPAPEPQAAPAEPARAAPKADSAPAQKVTPPVFNAAYLRNPEPPYPVSSRRRGEQGTVLLKVLVTRDGAPASVNVEKTSGYAALDQSALDAVRKWRFAPARQGAEPIESSVLVPIVFKLEGVS
jgi:protein TonB